MMVMGRMMMLLIDWCFLCLHPLVQKYLSLHGLSSPILVVVALMGGSHTIRGPREGGVERRACGGGEYN